MFSVKMLRATGGLQHDAALRKAIVCQGEWAAEGTPDYSLRFTSAAEQMSVSETPVQFQNGLSKSTK